MWMSTGRKAFVLGLMVALTADAQVSVQRLTLRGADADSRAAYFRQPLRLWGSNQYPDDPAFLSELVTLGNGRTTFALWCRGRTERDTGHWSTLLGMAGPSG